MWNYLSTRLSETPQPSKGDSNMRHIFTLVVLFAATCAFAAEAPLCTTGDSAEVLWNGKWYPAKVIDTKPDSCQITYTGYDSSWDEWVGADRIKIGEQPEPNPYPVGTAVQVLWNNKWYAAKVIELKPDSWKIHYDNYSDKWDEWVNESRIKAK